MYIYRSPASGAKRSPLATALGRLFLEGEGKDIHTYLYLYISLSLSIYIYIHMFTCVVCLCLVDVAGVLYV